MVKAIALTAALAVLALSEAPPRAAEKNARLRFAGSDQPVTPRTVSMQELTVPAERLPAECRLTPAPTEPAGQDRVRTGLWEGFPANPWVGADRDRLAAIAMRIEGAPEVPDGPPLSPAEASRFRVRMADGIEEGYAAFYSNGDSGRVTVVAFRRAAGAKEAGAPMRRGGRMAGARIDLGQTVVALAGDTGGCRQAVEAHLRSLAR